MDERQCPDWLQSYVEFTSVLEAPTIFHLWTGISCLSLVLNRRAWVDQQLFKVYPNMYIVLVAAPGVQHKSTAIRVGSRIINELTFKPREVAAKITPEALINCLKVRTEDEEDVVEFEDSRGYLFADELVNFINSNDGDKVYGILCEMYDCVDRWEYRTKHGGSEILKNVWFGILGATTVPGFKVVVPEHAILGGFASRLIVVCSGTSDKCVPWVQQPDWDVWKQLVHDIRTMEALPEGPFKVTPKAKSYYSEVYVVAQQHVLACDPGFMSRKLDNILKLAQIFSVSRSNDKIIDRRDILKAEATLNNLETQANKLLERSTTSPFGELALKALDLLVARKDEGMSMSEMSRIMIKKMNAADCHAMMDSLKQAGLITMEEIQGPTGRPKVVYRAVAGAEKALQENQVNWDVLNEGEE